MGDPGDALAAAAARLVSGLRERGLRLATAESCTGGLVAHALTEVAGASTVFEGGWVVYSNALKTREMGVPTVVLERAGAVSEAVALALARGARAESGADIAVSTTGIAGPGGGIPEKPVGLLWCAVADERGVTARQQVLTPRPRAAMKRAFAHAALQQVLAHLGE